MTKRLMSIVYVLRCAWHNILCFWKAVFCVDTVETTEEYLETLKHDYSWSIPMYINNFNVRLDELVIEGKISSVVKYLCDQNDQLLVQHYVNYKMLHSPFKERWEQINVMLQVVKKAALFKSEAEYSATAYIRNSIQLYSDSKNVCDN